MKSGIGSIRLPDWSFIAATLPNGNWSLLPSNFVHAALIFEHAGTGLALENALSLVAPGGRLSVVLQLPSREEQSIAPTQYTSMQSLKHCFTLIDTTEFQSVLEQKGFELLTCEIRPLPAGKAIWLGIFREKLR
jgi:hypothetical protein